MKNNDDKIKTGYNIGSADCNMAGAFILFRGAQMRDEWLNIYFDNEKNYMRLRGNTSCSRKLDVALGFALDKIGQDLKPVLFVTVC